MCPRQKGDFWAREYTDTTLTQLSAIGIGGVFDFLVGQTELLELYPNHRSRIPRFFKVVDYYFDEKSTAEPSLKVLRR